MKYDFSEKIELLLDTEYQRRIIEVMNEWCSNTHTKLNTAHADLVNKEISVPLWGWIDETQGGIKASNYPGIEASRAFAIKADEIVYILGYATRPLYPEYVAMLNDAWPNERRDGKTMSNNTILYALYRMGYHSRMTGHGFRGIASTILHERGYNHDHLELQLTHSKRDVASASYNPALYLEPRAHMMQDWADYLEALKTGAAILPFRSVG